MANLRTAMDSQFWDQPVSFPLTLEGCARSIPGDPFPLDASRASRALRMQQLSLLRNGFPLGIIPCYAPPPPSSSPPLSSTSTSSSALSPSNPFSSDWPLLTERPEHDITIEAAWPDLFINCKGGYREVPESISLDLSSLPSDSGFRYRFGIHKNEGHPHSINDVGSEVPCALRPGICAKAAFTYEKGKDFWRRKETKVDIVVQMDKGLFWCPSYDVRLNEPHAAISGVIGGTCAAWFGGKESSTSATNGNGNISIITMKRRPLNADLFGSVCYTFQHGRFWKLYGDLTRVDARLDICSVSAFAKRVFNVFGSSSATSAFDSSPRLNLILQQQVAGPIVFRVDSKFSLWNFIGETRSTHGGYDIQPELLVEAIALWKSGGLVFSKKERGDG